MPDMLGSFPIVDFTLGHPDLTIGHDGHCVGGNRYSTLLKHLIVLELDLCSSSFVFCIVCHCDIGFV